MPGYATYGAAKAFELALGEALHAELGAAGVAVTTLCPGPVATEFFAASGPQPIAEAMPRALWRDADEVARAAVRGLDRNRRIVIPGRLLRTLLSAGKFTPGPMRDRLVASSRRCPRRDSNPRRAA